MKAASDLLVRIIDHPAQIDASTWDALLAQQDVPTPFMKHACLLALHESQSAVASTGWLAQWVSIWQGDRLVAACPLYLKNHSYGEYVFDWAWASAYERHGLAYYPKAVVGVPFMPVPGSRLLAIDQQSRENLVQSVIDQCRAWKVSSAHLLFCSQQDRLAAQAAGLLLRQTVQFHWENLKYSNFEDYLSALQQEKRKKIKQERRKVAQAGIEFDVKYGDKISEDDWRFFYKCYEQTYWEHGNAPYLTAKFFEFMHRDMPEHWVMFVARKGSNRIACSLVGVQGLASAQSCAYGRYWGALERVDSLHFEACYYQPIQWCIQHGIARFEGGAQGEHKMARALMPVLTHSAHWLAHPQFSNAVDQFLHQEREGVQAYLNELHQRTPLRLTMQGRGHD